MFERTLDQGFAGMSGRDTLFTPEPCSRFYFVFEAIPMWGSLGS